MTLATLWKESRAQLRDKHVQQIIGFAGDGRMLDGSRTSSEFREFLSIVEPEALKRYAMECLSTKFNDSGLALQDIVNQIGLRLGLSVAYGRYRGTRNSPGHDGLWRFPDKHAAVIEVKTTDQYRIDSSKIAGYRKELIDANEIDEGRSSILIVVGRQDTGDLEAQIRGSRYAWDTRLISVEALLRLMFLKYNLDDPKIIDRICSILVPREFTRLDQIVDLAFSAAEDAKIEDEDTAEESVPVAGQRTSKPAAFHQSCIDRVANFKKIDLVRRTRTQYTTPDNKIAAVCSVSKTHERQGRVAFWFAFHPYQRVFLSRHAEGYLVLGCGSADEVLLIPFRKLEGWLDDLWVTENEDRMYWHIRIHPEGSCLWFETKRNKGHIDVSEFAISQGGV